MNAKTPVILALVLMVTAATAANAQSSNDALMSPEELQAAKEFVDLERDMALNANLDLTDQESQAFWPLYKEYRAKIRKVRGRKLTLIEAYAEQYRAGIVDGEFAEMAVKDWLKIQLETVKIRQRYWKKFRRILPATKAARFYQLENKMDAEIDFVLAGGVPLIEDD